MKILICLAASAFMLTTFSQASLYAYPTRIRPSLSLEDAIKVCNLYLAKKKLGDFYVTSVSMFGSKEHDGDGAWSIRYDSEKSEKVIVLSIGFPDDRCSLSVVDGEAPEEFKRKGAALAE